MTKEITAYKNGHWFVFRFRNLDELTDKLLSFVKNSNLDFDGYDAIGVMSRLNFWDLE